MNDKETTIIKNSIRLIFNWMKQRRPGRAGLEWRVQDQPPAIGIDLILPEMHLTPEEQEFLPGASRLFSLNGSTPRSLMNLEEARKQLTEIKGTLTIGRLEPDGFQLKMDIPVDIKDQADIQRKAELIQDVINTELKPGDE